jgi:hypothetical protein
VAGEEDPETALEAETKRRKLRAYVMVVAAVVALPMIVWGVVTLWERNVRAGLVGGLVVGVVLTHRTMRKAMERRRNPQD